MCGIVEYYRTFVEDFKRVLEFVEWLEDGKLTMISWNMARFS